MSSSTASNALENRLLSALPPEISQRLVPHLELVRLPSQQILYQVGEPISHVYFPQRSLFSLMNLLSNGSMLEVGLVGSEGMLGIPVILGGDRSFQQVVTQAGSQALRLPAIVLHRELEQSHQLRTVLLQYVQVVLMQMAHLSACHRFHSVRERLARQLLLIQDALQDDAFSITQECLAHMLGARRSGVTVAASELSRAGMIQCRRGRIEILQRQSLEAASCECYRMIRHEFDQFFSPD